MFLVLRSLDKTRQFPESSVKSNGHTPCQLRFPSSHFCQFQSWLWLLEQLVHLLPPWKTQTRGGKSRGWTGGDQHQGDWGSNALLTKAAPS